MAIQKFADLGTTFDTNNIKGTIPWDCFIEAIKAGKSCRVSRLRFLGDYVCRGHLILDLSYMYVVIDGEIYDCTDFPIWNWHGRNTKHFRKELFDVVKKTGVFVPGVFDGLSLHI